MFSNKCRKYLKQYQERNYGSKVRKLEIRDIKKHSHRSEGGEKCEASGRDSLLESRKEQEEINLCKMNVVENDEFVTYSCEEVRTLHEKWKEEFRLKNRVEEPSRDLSYINFCRRIDDFLDNCNCYCNICKKEDHEGMFCRCESRNISLAKHLRSTGKSKWVRREKENGESETRLGSSIQSSGEECSEIRSGESSSCCGSSRNKEVRRKKDGKDSNRRKKKIKVK